MIWELLAKFCAIPAVAQWLFKRAERTPYTHIMSADGQSRYMGRWWLFNPFSPETGKPRWPRLPSVRVHHICRPDQDRHLHDHPWNARTIILANYYAEQRQDGATRILIAGDTAAIRHGEYHRISAVHPSGAWTLFITWRYQGTWGFLVDGVKVPWRKYLGK